MTDYKTIQYEMLYTASLNAKKALKEGNEILEYASNCVLETDINDNESVIENLESILNKDRTKNIINGFNNNKLCEELCQKCGFKR